MRWKSAKNKTKASVSRGRKMLSVASNKSMGDSMKEERN